MIRHMIGLLSFVLMVGCSGAGTVPTSDQRILFLGDSLLAWHRLSGQSIPQGVRRGTGATVVDRSAIGAQMAPHANAGIPDQMAAGDWNWVVINGGGNDLWFGCNCSRCAKRLNRVISADGQSGALPDLVRKARASGAQVLMVGYLRSPGRGSLIEHCKDDGDALEARMARLAAREDGVEFLSNQDLVPFGDTSFHAPDRIHPSVKGSASIAARISAVVRG